LLHFYGSYSRCAKERGYATAILQNGIRLTDLFVKAFISQDGTVHAHCTPDAYNMKFAVFLKFNPQASDELNSCLKFPASIVAILVSITIIMSSV